MREFEFSGYPLLSAVDGSVKRKNFWQRRTIKKAAITKDCCWQEKLVETERRTSILRFGSDNLKHDQSDVILLHHSRSLPLLELRKQLP